MAGRRSMAPRGVTIAIMAGYVFRRPHGRLPSIVEPRRGTVAIMATETLVPPHCLGLAVACQTSTRRPARLPETASVRARSLNIRTHANYCNRTGKRSLTSAQAIHDARCQVTIGIIPHRRDRGLDRFQTCGHACKPRSLLANIRRRTRRCKRDFYSQHTSNKSLAQTRSHRDQQARL